MISDMFEWDKGNVKKSALKHNVYPFEAMIAFFDPKRVVFEDLKHSLGEARYICLGKSVTGRLLLTVFTERNGKIRIISTRKANRKDVQAYFR